MTGQRAENTQEGRADLCGASDWLPAETVHGEQHFSLQSCISYYTAANGAYCIWTLPLTSTNQDSDTHATPHLHHPQKHTSDQMFSLKWNLWTLWEYLNVSTVRREGKIWFFTFKKLVWRPQWKNIDNLKCQDYQLYKQPRRSKFSSLTTFL